MRLPPRQRAGPPATRDVIRTNDKAVIAEEVVVDVVAAALAADKADTVVRTAAPVISKARAAKADNPSKAAANHAARANTAASVDVVDAAAVGVIGVKAVEARAATTIAAHVPKASKAAERSDGHPASISGQPTRTIAPDSAIEPQRTP